MATTVYLVQGLSGYYEDRNTWIDSIWWTKGEADAEARRLNEWFFDVEPFERGEFEVLPMPIGVSSLDEKED